jgi:ligand-binding sensor domain-containing protein/serine phosphatase RsbU (regulator of sigma subunit)
MTRAFLLSAAVTCCACLNGQTYNFRSFTEEEGLPQNYVYHISQDVHGKLIFSTGEAVCSYDGMGFSVLTPTSLTEHFVAEHLTDSRGRIWVAHHQGGVSLIASGKTTRYAEKGLAEGKVTGLAENSDGSIIAASSVNGLYLLNASGRSALVKGAPLQVRCMLQAEPGVLLIGCEEGVCQVEVKSGTASVRKLALPGSDIPRQLAKAFHTEQSFWVLTEENNIYLVQVTSNDIRLIGKLVEPNLSNYQATCISGGSGGTFWVGLQNAGVISFAFSAANPLNPTSAISLNSTNGLRSDQVQTIFEDREGNTWFGTFGEGLIQKPATKFVYYGANEGLDVKNVAAVVTSGTEMLWLGTPGGLIRYNKATLRLQRFQWLNKLSDKSITALAWGTHDDLWIGTAGHGVFVADTGKHTLRQIGDEALYINCILRNGENMMAGTTDGLYLIDANSGKTEVLRTNEGLLHNNVRHLCKDATGRVWISSHGAPPYFIRNGEILPYRKIEGLSSYNINSICEDKQKNIWIATEGDGVFMYDNRTFVNYTSANGLLSDFCTGIVGDQNNSVWITHKNGLSEKTAGRNSFVAYDSKKGLLYSKNSLNAITRDGAGNLWFGTASGLVHYEVRGRVTKGIRPTISITGVLLNEESRDHTSRIEADYGEYTFEVNFLSVCLRDPTTIEYRYRMPLSDSNWTSTREGKVTFPKLRDGIYDFEVMACNLDNDLCSEVARVNLQIGAPVWKRGWFYLMLFVAVSVITYLIVYLRTMRLRRSQLMLQLKVKQKTFLLQREKQIVESIKLELESKNKDITDSINYAKRIQDSILPPDETLASLFGDNYFVLFKPKDIVSGDFYWAARLAAIPGEREELSLAAVIDCTGHGVPGAFLSIMANDFLKQSISEVNVHSPDHVLNFINQSVSSHLNQTSQSKVRDGMDIALIGIDRTRNVLHFSGANNPIYVFREVNGEVDQIILTATKQAIGMVTDETRPFALRQLNLQKGDIVYLFSDGFADQFGGPNNKKLSYKRFRDILSAGFRLPMHEQKQLLDEEFEKWKGHSHQTDDVCVMGIRV